MPYNGSAIFANKGERCEDPPFCRARYIKYHHQAGYHESITPMCKVGGVYKSCRIPQCGEQMGIFIIHSLSQVDSHPNSFFFKLIFLCVSDANQHRCHLLPTQHQRYLPLNDSNKR